MAADRTPNDLADFIARKGKNRRSYALAYPAGSEMRAWIMAEAEQYHAAARLLREQAEQFDALDREFQASEVRSQANYNFAARYRTERDEARRQLDTLRNAVQQNVDWLDGTSETMHPMSTHAVANSLRDALAAAGGGVRGEGATDG